MQPIPEPELLDPARVGSDEREGMTAGEHRDRARLYAKALDESCEYARQLWHELDTVRGYLLRSLPDDPARPDARRHATAPTGPDDETGWQEWMTTYGRVTSVLAGIHGDAGFGESEAQREARARREVVVPIRPTPGDLGAGDVATDPGPVAAPVPAGRLTGPPASRLPAPLAGPLGVLARPLPMAVLLALAARGLRPRGRVTPGGAG
jgi:hypothetical protein